jgi:uncharacterized protein YceK
MRFLLAACLCLPIAGCSSIMDMAAEKDGQRIYGGTQRNVSLVNGELNTTHSGVVEVLIGVCDFPCSLALDTALLPVTLIFAIARSGTMTQFHRSLDQSRCGPD